MAIPLNDNVLIEANKSADPKYGPFNSVGEALAFTPEVYRPLGLTVGVITAGAVVEYWFKEGVTDADLELKSGGGGGSVDTVNGQAPDGAKNVLIGAEHIDLAPTDTGYFSGLLTAGKLKLNAFADKIVADLKKQASKDFYFRYDEVSVDSEDEIFFTRKMAFTGVSWSDQITGVSFFVKLNNGTYLAKANYTDVNSWIVENITTGVKYWIKTQQTRIANGAGPGQVILAGKET